MTHQGSIRRTALAAILAVAFLLLPACAHRRQAYYPSDIGPSDTVHVRAPFVDIHVKKKPKHEGMERLSRHDDDDDDRDDD